MSDPVDVYREQVQQAQESYDALLDVFQAGWEAGEDHCDTDTENADDQEVREAFHDWIAP